MFLKKILLCTGLAVVSALGATVAQAGESCPGFGTTLKTEMTEVQRILEIREQAEPLREFVRQINLSRTVRGYIDQVYKSEKDSDLLFKALTPTMKGIKANFDGSACRPGSTYVENLPDPMCKDANGKTTYARRRIAFLSLATAGLHPHLYATSCQREGGSSTCLSIDLLDHREDNDELDLEVAAKIRQAKKSGANHCVGANQTDDAISTKAVEAVKTLVHEAGHSLDKGSTPAK